MHLEFFETKTGIFHSSPRKEVRLSPSAPQVDCERFLAVDHALLATIIMLALLYMIWCPPQAGWAGWGRLDLVLALAIGWIR